MVLLRNAKQPKQLLLDMKVRWGSTYVMLTRAESLRKVCIYFPSLSLYLPSGQDIDQFVFELSMKEGNAEKRRKLGDLTLSADEWGRVSTICDLLDVS